MASACSPHGPCGPCVSYCSKRSVLTVAADGRRLRITRNLASLVFRKLQDPSFATLGPWQAIAKTCCLRRLRPFCFGQRSSFASRRSLCRKQRISDAVGPREGLGHSTPKAENPRGQIVRGTESRAGVLKTRDRGPENGPAYRVHEIVTNRQQTVDRARAKLAPLADHRDRLSRKIGSAILSLKPDPLEDDANLRDAIPWI